MCRVVVLREDELLGIQRARSDIAVDDAQRGQSEDDAARIGYDIPILVERGRGSSLRRVPRLRDDRPGAELVRRLVQGSFDRAVLLRRGDG
jgi:hypothetical protein